MKGALATLLPLPMVPIVDINIVILNRTAYIILLHLHFWAFLKVLVMSYNCNGIRNTCTFFENSDRWQTVLQSVFLKISLLQLNKI